MLSELDTHKWDQTINASPNHKNFSYSLFGKSFYIVGMHPKSSRIARKSPYIALVFNLNWQCEKLREMGKYDFIRTKIRERD
ncbi:YqcI/YcgG family protein [Mesonia aestuariivivens]|uniref:YqcI/YcgG family protein n=1 Tax=Mesonia aestuariivivens TaxID=2796128 RepID=A0ABS6W1H5_9FLAO|nr:YqcI/YcgG family protein [Mesonia aestuariivivens]